MTKGHWTLLQSAAGLVLCGYAFPALAQTASPPVTTEAPAAPNLTDQSGDIIVTAQRRSERLQDVPIAVSVISGDQAASRGIVDVKSLAATVPNFSVMRNSNALNLFIRGVGSSGNDSNVENSVAVYVDGVYQPSPSAASTFSLANIQRVEVLKGPQGTLFGRNATGGVVQIITKDPTQELSGQFSFGYGNYATDTESGYIAGGLTDGLAASLSFYRQRRADGFGKNVTTNTENFTTNDVAIRGKLVATPGLGTKLTLAGGYSRSEGNLTAFQSQPGLTSIDGYTGYIGDFNSRNSIAPYNNSKQHDFSLRLDQTIGDVDLVSITAYGKLNALFSVDVDRSPAVRVDAQVSQRVENFSQEIQLLGSKNPAFSWLLGAFYINMAADANTRLLQAPGAAVAYTQTYGDQRTDSKSLFAHITSEFIKGTKLTIGLRFTNEIQSVTGNQSNPSGITAVFGKRRQSFNKLTWRVALDQDFSSAVHGYISYSRGLNTGGFSVSNPGNAGAKPEELDAYEIGLKSQFFDRRLRFNIAAFYYDYTNKIVITRTQGSATALTTNAAAAKLYGIDLDADFAVTDRLTLSGSVGLLHSEYTNYNGAQVYGANPGAASFINASGLRLDGAPNFTGSASLDYTVPVSFGKFAFNATVVHSADKLRSLTLILPQYTLVNSTLTWTSKDDRLSIKAWARNLFDERYLAYGSTSGFGNLVLQGEPRTYGATLLVKF